MARAWFGILLVFLLRGPGVTAQVPGRLDTTLSWSLEQCLAYARDNNLQLQALRLSRESARQDLAQAERNRLPLVYGSTSQTLVNSRNANPVVGGFQTQAKFSSSYGLNSSLVLYNGGYLRRNIEAGRLTVQEAGLAVEEADNNLTLGITQAFLNILLARENITYFEAILSTSQEQLRQGQQRYDAGSISRKDLLQLQSQQAADAYSLVNARTAYQLGLASLRQLLQLPPSCQLTVVVPERIEPEELVPSLEATQQMAQEHRPEIRYGDLAIRLAETEVAMTRAGRLPTVNLGAGLSSGYSDNQSSKYLSQLGNNFYQTLGLSASVPIFSRNLNRTNLAKARIVLEQARLALESSRVTLNQEVEQAYLTLQNAQAEYVAAGAQLQAAEATYQITNEQLKAGAISLVEVLLQKNSYVQAMQAYLLAKYQAVLYSMIYQFYAGQPIRF
ncbi:MAG TPA: TolC family protein [Chitinophagaceae bacterium]|nr:TolC family protein [Chitinophagaceae bacterium]